MGIRKRDICVRHDGHEIALSAALTGWTWMNITARYKLYVDGKVVDQESVWVWAMLFGTSITLRCQLPPKQKGAKPRPVKVVATVRVLKCNDYLFFVQDEVIHQEWATYGGM